jgi:CheY-like chemotaxis protein
MQKKPVILVVEDQKINREILKGILNEDFEVIETSNGEEALEVLKEKSEVDAILLDLLMPVMDGYAFMKEFKKSPYSSIPVIAVTGDSEDGTEQKTLDMGAWDFVSKPYQPMTLVTRLENAIKRSEYFRLGDLLLNSLGVPVGVFQITGEEIRIIRLSRELEEIALSKYGVDINKPLDEQNAFDEESKKLIKEAFLKTSKEKDCNVVHFYQSFKDGTKKHIQIAIRYWGINKTSVILFGEFSFIK